VRRELALVAMMLVAPSVRADNVQEAKALFLAGAAAYEQHNYVGAIRAFEGAQKLAPRPANLFSLAQAHRRQFYRDGNSAHEKAAIDYLREYVKEVPEGGRHDDAMRALQELGALQPQQDVASVSINSSGTPNARVALDGAAPVEAPLIGPVSPGKHHAVISADGFVSEARDVTAINGQIVALDVPLKERPARVVIDSPPGAAVAVDGRPVGETPLAPLELPAGAHIVSISKNGHEAFVRDLDLARGDEQKLTAPLHVTRQRTIATGMLVASAVVVLGAGTCTAFAAYWLGQANGVLGAQRRGPITLDDVARYDDARAMRNDFLIAAGISFATAGALAATGLVLFVFDKPDTTGEARGHEGPKPETKPTPVDFSFAPLVSPNVLGATALVRF